MNRGNIKKLLLIITFAVVLFWGMRYIAPVWSFLGMLVGVLTPFIIGLAIAFIVNVLMRALERLWGKLFGGKGGKWSGRLKRPCCLLLSLVLIVAVIFIILFMIVPELNRTVEFIIDMMPEYIDQMVIWWGELGEFLSGYSLELPDLQTGLHEFAESIRSFLTTSGSALFGQTLAATSSVFGAVFNVVLGVIFAIYVLAQKETLGTQVRKLLYAYLPERRADSVMAVAELSNRTFGKFVTGQLTEAVIIGSICFVGMTLFSIPYATMVSVLVGFTSLIPVFGAFIGTAIGAFLIVMVDPWRALGFIIFIIVLQQVEGNLIYPRVVGKSVGLPGIWVLAAVTIGGSLFGMLGLLISVPVCSVLYALLRHNVNKRLAAKGLEVQELGSLAIGGQGKPDDVSAAAKATAADSVDGAAAVPTDSLTNDGKTESVIESAAADKGQKAK